jgi:hypothetical protein
VDPRIDKICDLGRVIISAQYMFQSYGTSRKPDVSERMPPTPDGSDDTVCVFLSLCSHHLLYTQDIDQDAGSSDEELKSNAGSVNDLHEEES